jgi:thioesterase domain-containing protein
LRPRDPVELLVERAWAEVLGRPWVGVRDSFASLGGDESARQRMLERVARDAGIGAAEVAIGQAETVERLAAALKRISKPLHQRARAFWARNTQAPPDNGRPPLFFFHGERSGGLQWLETMARLGPDQPVFGIAPHVTSGQPIPPTVEAIAAGYLQLVRDIQPRGPYLLGGHCNGSVAAYEAARQLLDAGERLIGVLLVAPLLPATYRRGVMGLFLRFPLRVVDRAVWVSYRIRRRTRRALGLKPPRYPSPTDYRDSELFDRYSAILQAYRPPPVSGPATIVWPREELRRFRLPSEWVWRRVAPGARVVEVPGAHMGCCGPEHRAETARELRRAIDAFVDTARSGG